MKLLAPRPFLLALTLVLVACAVAFIEFRLDAGGAQAYPQPAEKQPKTDPQPTKKASGETAASSDEKAIPESSDDTEKPASPERAEDEK